MRSDASLDDEIKTLEQRIRDRRLAFRESIDELEEAASAAKDRLRQKATSPVVWGGALVVGFLAARFAGLSGTDWSLISPWSAMSWGTLAPLRSNSVETRAWYFSGLNSIVFLARTPADAYSRLTL